MRVKASLSLLAVFSLTVFSLFAPFTAKAAILTSSGSNAVAAKPASTFAAIAHSSSVYTYYLPLVANQYVTKGAPTGYTTFLAFQNFGSAAANVSIQYFDQLGDSVAAPADTCTSVPLNGECVAPNPFKPDHEGTGILTSDQPLNVLMAEATPFGGAAYVVPSGASGSVNVPLAYNHYLGVYSTQLNVYNVNSVATTVTVQYYSHDGIPTTSTSVNIPAHVSVNLSQEDANLNLPYGFDGWAEVSVPSGYQVVAQMLEHHATNGFVTVVNSVAQTSTNLYAPAIFNNAFGFFTGAKIVNPNNTPVTVTVTYYKVDGTVINTDPFTLNALSTVGIYHGLNQKAPGLPNDPTRFFGFNGAAQITATGGGVVMVVNEDGGYNLAGKRKSGTYSAIPAGGNQVGLPVVANGGYHYITGITIFNTSNITVTGQIQYYNVDGTPAGSSHTFTVGPNASIQQFQGDASIGLPTTFYGTAVITESSSGTDLIATVNALSDEYFYTYAEPVS